MLSIRPMRVAALLALALLAAQTNSATSQAFCRLDPDSSSTADGIYYDGDSNPSLTCPGASDLECKYEPCTPTCSSASGNPAGCPSVSDLLTTVSTKPSSPNELVSFTLKETVSAVLVKASTGGCFYTAPYVAPNQLYETVAKSATDWYGVSHITVCIPPCSCTAPTDPPTAWAGQSSSIKCTDEITLPKSYTDNCGTSRDYTITVSPGTSGTDYTLNGNKVTFSKCGTYTVTLSACGSNTYTATYVVSDEVTPTAPAVTSGCPGTVFSLPTYSRKCSANTAAPTYTVYKNCDPSAGTCTATTPVALTATTVTFDSTSTPSCDTFYVKGVFDCGNTIYQSYTVTDTSVTFTGCTYTSQCLTTPQGATVEASKVAGACELKVTTKGDNACGTQGTLEYNIKICDFAKTASGSYALASSATCPATPAPARLLLKRKLMSTV